MKYWWVNQNQTYKYEVPGGYLWSPKVTKSGAKNRYYDSMTQVSPGDVVFSFSEANIKAIGIIQSYAETRDKPLEFGETGDYWNTNGWYVEVVFKELPSNQQITPKNDLEKIQKLIDYPTSPLIKKTGYGKQNVYLTDVTAPLANYLESEIGISLASLQETLFDAEKEVKKSENAILNDTSLTETEKTQLIKSRRGQGLFKRNVSNINPNCFFTGITDGNFLRASHIKPWSESNNTERLDGHNGILLVPHIDHLFDGGFITFTDEGALIVSSDVPTEIIDSYHLLEQRTPRQFTEQQKVYMQHHRLHVFQKRQKNKKISTTLED